MGNKADLSGNDFLRYWEQDAGTDVVLLYLESLGNPQRFGADLPAADRGEADRRRQERALSAAGRRAASSHTGALLQASEAAVDALFDHAGVIRAETLGEQLDVAALLAHQPLPRGRPRGDRHQCRRTGDLVRRCRMAAGLRVEPLTEGTAGRSPISCRLRRR